MNRKTWIWLQREVISWSAKGLITRDVADDNVGRIYRCEIDVGESPSEVWDVMVRKDWYEDGYVLTRNFYDDVFLHIKPSWVKSFIEDITPPQQLEMFK